ncbi:hypothetical protein [Burkholderia sp. PU8-34]
MTDSAMIEDDPILTEPILGPDMDVWFSAYGFGWGYRAFTLGEHVVREELGAADASPKQLLLAFKLGRQRIRLAVKQHGGSNAGERASLDSADL